MRNRAFPIGSWTLSLNLCSAASDRDIDWQVSGSPRAGGGFVPAPVVALTSANPPASPFSLFQPPPPGCPPNAAQLAVMQGANVLVTQRKGNFFLGGSDGGYTIW